MGWLRYTDPSAFEAPNADAEKQGMYTLEANPGMIETLPPGMEFVAWNPDHPANAFQNFVITLLRQVATGLGVSYNALASDLVGVNYSSLRSGMLIERDLWRRLQSFLIESLLSRVFEEWLDLALLSGELVLDSRDPARFLEGLWQPRGWQWVDPLKDVQSALLGIDGGLTSRTDVLADKGEDVEAIFEQLSQEKKLAKQYGLQLETSAKAPKVSKETGEEITPEETTAEPARAFIVLSGGKQYELNYTPR
jgi:lambda family phage portal protein